MRIRAVVIVLALAGACSDSTEPSGQVPVPPLEAIPFELLGTGKIAFERVADRYHGVYLIDPVAQTTSVIGSGDFNGPALSPDGEHLAVTAYADESGSADIYTHKTDGSSHRRISGYLGDEGVPSWMPDGLGLTFLRAGPNSFDRVIAHIQASDGFVERSITLNRADACSSSYFGDIDNRVEVSSTGLIATPCSLIELVILSSDGVRVARYTTVLPSIIIGFAWSPDGSKLAVMEMAGAPGSNVPVSQTLRIVSPQGTLVRDVFTVPLSLTQNGRYPGSMDSAICWLKGTDRLLVAVLNQARRYSQLRVVNEDGTGLTKITTATQVTDRSITCSR